MWCPPSQRLGGGGEGHYSRIVYFGLSLRMCWVNIVNQAFVSVCVVSVYFVTGGNGWNVSNPRQTEERESRN